MPAIAWLLAALASGAGAYLVGWPAWRSYRSRDAVDSNSERYLAWRGRASHEPRPREGMTGEERRRVYAGVVLGIAAAAALIAFFATS